ncbi:MAG: lipoyl(octanoyl) transferase LipB [Gammaproteobacteria bacterium]|nr:lipoyl(octanoyl) transferase LipB [Rhodocyclaceae bacterium]MBU3908014.1 lipoyl(octanoyl) transferase LipB [Gammaproteobacteria bacterium]MBU3990604.1 lipoyl(octanoyl) transferase LipB [Gammaproteobacteria bacterium]MBU4006055.1 lipoyl(octanoyl) transferase LipB [Gammaproteobacteria bacterium]MBU4022056.1 lipoyl(octanoyl) transferase LipB [Gammaproteobacteria bacterium]
MGQDRPLIFKPLGRVEYEPTWRAMQEFTAQRGSNTPDELRLCEHPPVFTQGLAGKPEHLLADIGIPVVKIDRGGQITYHGPGQLVCYLLLDLKPRGLGIKGLVNRMEQAVIDLLAEFGVNGERLPGAPGVYVAGAKIAALGLKVKNGCCYHGLALNVAMDLSPFAAINPCGYPGMAVTQLSAFVPTADSETVGAKLVDQLRVKL